MEAQVQMLLGAALYLLQRFWLPALLVWGGARFVMGVSVVYLLKSVCLELLLKVWSCFTPETAVQPKASQTALTLTAEQKALPLRGCKVTPAKEYTASGQTLPPTKRVATICKEPPAGQQMDYGDSVSSKSWGMHFGRAAKEETSLGQVEDEAWLQKRRCLREGAEVHRQVRQYVQQKVRPGMELLEIAEMVEKASSSLVGFDARNPLRRGWAFPTGLSLNEVAAHDTVNPGDAPRWLSPADLLKVDFGVHVEGHILDCAFSLAFDPMHDELMRTVQEATEEGIRHAGHDARIADIGSRIREVMEAGEVHRSDGKVLPVKAIQNLTGHSIGPYKIHSGKSLPSVDTGGNERMLAGELWAVETFGSAGGLGYVGNGGNCSHFMRTSSSAPSQWQRSMLSSRALNLLELIDKRFSTLAFCPRWVVQEAERSKFKLAKGSDQRWWSSPLDELCNVGVVGRYPPLADLRGSYTAQYEHTILLGSSKKEVLTRGTDY
ncbi:unnamed protein product [Effrenium voratum]|uniref:Peptidase M24 domain-containing protein n=1 Tax=Effrenium voratum TaxID=2562239 RepID=A0AA36JN06_9DINO|nr:unnamed protein product [Effrenium voratum]